MVVYRRGITNKIRTGWESQIRQQTSRRTRRTLALTNPSWFLVQRIPKFDLAWEYEWVSSRNLCFTSSFSLMYQPSQMLSFWLQLWYRASRTQNIETLKHPNETAWNQWPLIQDFRSTIIGSRGTVQISDQKVWDVGLNTRPFPTLRLHFQGHFQPVVGSRGWEFSVLKADLSPPTHDPPTNLSTTNS